MIDELNTLKIDVQSYLLLKEGLKPVIRVGLSPSEICKIGQIKKCSEKLGMKILTRKFKKFYGQVLDEPTIISYYSFDEKKNIEAHEAEKTCDRKKLGLLLGYPKCCIDNFKKSLRNLEKNEYIINALKNTTKKPSFYCNNLFVFDSKLSSTNTDIFYKNMDIFDSDDVRDLFLVRHVPCSFDCKESMMIGKTTLKLLQDNFPELAKRITNALKNPVIYWDYFKWIIINGEVNDNEIIYNKTLNYKSLIEPEIKQMMEKGNRIILDNEKMTIFNNDIKIGELKRNNKIPVCINFE